jgi:hypothetical protein
MGSEEQRSHARCELRRGAYTHLGIDCLGLKRVGAEWWGARGAPPRSVMAVFEHLGDDQRATLRRRRSVGPGSLTR